MAKLEELDGIWADGRFEPKQPQEPKKPFLQMRAEFIRKWGGSGSGQLTQELDVLLREYLRMLAA
jgi:hypothetical protein